jgi:hypothetical protein
MTKIHAMSHSFLQRTLLVPYLVTPRWRGFRAILESHDLKNSLKFRTQRTASQRVYHDDDTFRTELSAITFFTPSFTPSIHRFPNTAQPYEYDCWWCHCFGARYITRERSIITRSNRREEKRRETSIVPHLIVPCLSSLHSVSTQSSSFGLY